MSPSQVQEPKNQYVLLLMKPTPFFAGSCYFVGVIEPGFEINGLHSELGVKLSNIVRGIEILNREGQPGFQFAATKLYSNAKRVEIPREAYWFARLLDEGDESDLSVIKTAQEHILLLNSSRIVRPNGPDLSGSRRI